MRLDAKSVAALKLDGKTDAIFFDDTLPCFGYRLRRSHDRTKVLRSWIVQYKRAGATRRITLGSAEVLSAEAARTAAKKVLARVHLGEDPAADRRDRREKDKLSVRSQVDEYLAIKAREVRPTTLREVTRYLSGTYFQPLHKIAVDKVSRKDVASRLVAISREHGDTVAAKARDTIGAFFVWAMQHGLVENNPVIGTRKPQGNKPRDRVLSDSELAAIWRACQDDDYGRIVRLLILLGARRQEIGGIAWTECDLEGPQPSWTLAASRSKNGRAHKLPLMGMALDIIKGVPRMVSRDQLFGARSEDGFASWDKGKTALDARCGITERWTPHDIRRSVATRMADIGIAPHIIEQILNHQSGHKRGPAGIYNRSSYEREVRAALALWEDHIRTLIEGGERKIVAFERTAVNVGDAS
jgi:integrase